MEPRISFLSKGRASKIKTTKMRFFFLKNMMHAVYNSAFIHLLSSIPENQGIYVINASHQKVIELAIPLPLISISTMS